MFIKVEEELLWFDKKSSLLLWEEFEPSREVVILPFLIIVFGISFWADIGRNRLDGLYSTLFIPTICCKLVSTDAGVPRDFRCLSCEDLL